jgi:hypothetical protein
MQAQALLHHVCEVTGTIPSHYRWLSGCLVIERSRDTSPSTPSTSQHPWRARRGCALPDHTQLCACQGQRQRAPRPVARAHYMR